MSIFPAYSDEISSVPSNPNVVSDTEKVVAPTDWLSNSSFHKIPSTKLSIAGSTECTTDDSDGISCSEERLMPDTISSVVKTDAIIKKTKRIKKRKKEKHKHKCTNSIKVEYQKDVENVYFEDRFRDKGNNSVNTLCSRVRPHYSIGKKRLGFVSCTPSKKETFGRYYMCDDYSKKLLKKNAIISRSTDKSTPGEGEELIPTWCVNLEEEQKQKTQEYNERLMKEPNNIQLWIQYIEFQDTLAKFQNRWLMGEDVQRFMLIKKLSIIEKALEKNTESKALLRLKLRFMGELYPADQFSNEMETLVNKDLGNIVLWKVFIMVTQGSVAMCTVPKVLELYSKCFCTLRQRSRMNPLVFDDHLLEMLHRCSIFLRHTGLWEQMWEMIRLNLSLNLNLNKENLCFLNSIDEKKLIGMEEVILMSRLPLNQLWLRIESLRENCHWISVTKDQLELVGDSRRFILPEDVADFVHPIISRDSNFRMAIYSLLALKVPLLPTRNYMLKDLALKEFEWGADSSEILLPFAYPSVGEMAGYKERSELMKSILEGKLTSGPQYLQFHPAQEPYLDFIREIFHTIAESMHSSQRTCIYIWWLRFERLLIFLGKNDPLKCDKGRKLRTTLKEFLKKDENRNNLHFYKEYALIEREFGRFDHCINILEMAIQSQTSCPSLIVNLEERAALFNLYRTYIETLLSSDKYTELYKNRILNIFAQMIPKTTKNEVLSVEEYLHDYVQKFLEKVPTDTERDKLFLPNLDCDIIVCYAYFLYTKNNNIYNVIGTFKNCIEHSKDCPRLQEMLHEGEISILQLHRERIEELDIFRSELNNALESCPDNFYVLSVFASIESELPNWKLNTTKDDLRLWKAIAVCLAGRRRIHFLMKRNDVDAAKAAVNKSLSLHRTLARIPEVRCCPLIWRMYMLLLREQNLCERRGEEIYHESVVCCPWARSIYIDAAEIAPQLLTQIQDVIREKELRMHVTPEELDILRG